MKFRCFILCILFQCFKVLAFCQSSAVIDSLELALSSTSDDSSRVNILNELAFEYNYYDLKKAKVYAKEACQLSQKLMYLSGEGDCLVRLGTIAMLEQNFVEAEEHLNAALNLRKKLSNVENVASVYNLKGLVEYYQDNDKKAIQHYLQGLEVVRELPKLNIKATLHNNASNSFRALGDYAQAIVHIDQGISIKEKNGEDVERAKLLMTLGNWYSEIDNQNKAIEKFQIAIKIFQKYEDYKRIADCLINIGNAQYLLGDFNKTLEYLDKALAQKKYLDSNSIANLYRTIGNVFRNQNLYDKAIDAFERSLGEFEILNEGAEIASLNYNIGLLEKDKSNFKNALKYFKKCQSFLDTINYPILEMKVSNEISDTYLRLGDIDKAFKFSLKHNLIQDSLDQSYREAINYKLNYEEEKQRNELLKREIKVNELITQKKAVKMKIYIGLGVVLFLFFLMAYIYISNKKRAKQKLESKKKEIDALLKEQEVKTTYAKLEGQDEERRRIAQDLHDRVGSILSTVKLYFDGFNSKLDSMQTQNQNNHLKANELLDEAVSEVRKIAHDMHSGTLVKFGLKAELEALSELLRNSKKMDIEVISYEVEERLPLAIEIKIYRIIQELISNVLKHADAKKITIQLNLFKDVVNFIVQDDGIGFDVNATEGINGMGLKSIRSRVHDLHGTIIIDSGKGNGTTVTVDIPREGGVL